MKNKTEGYVIDLPYEIEYFRPLSPSLLRLLCVLHGTDLPKRKKNEPLRYLELGYGQGLSLNVHAATIPGEFWGTDFNLDHVLKAQEAAQSADLNVNLLDSSFADLDKKCADGNLPQFDIITFHGIWSWVNEENRQHILNIITNNLKIGGIVYVSYNAFPGWASFVPIRDLFMMHADTVSASHVDSAARLQNSYNFVTALEKAGANYFIQNPSATKKLKSLENQSIAYLSHEYMNSNLRPFYFKDVAEALSSTKCSFLTSTQLLTQMNISLPAEILPLLANAPTVAMREAIRDFALNRFFRCDVFIKGKVILPIGEQTKILKDMPISLTIQAEAVSARMKTAHNGISFKAEFYEPVLQALAENNYAPKTLNYLAKHPACKDINENMLNEIFIMLLATDYIHPTQEVDKAQKIASARLNAFFCEKSRKGTYSKVLASPVLGGGIAVTRVEQLFLDAQLNKMKSPEELAKYTYDILLACNDTINKDGKALDPEASLEVLVAGAKSFIKERLPFLQALGAVISFEK